MADSRKSFPKFSKFERGPERERRPAARGRLLCQWGVRARLILAKTFARQRALGHGSEMV